MPLNQYIGINDLTCKVWLRDIRLSTIMNDGRIDRQTDRYTHEVIKIKSITELTIYIDAP